jgi:hypothetical protein
MAAAKRNLRVVAQDEVAVSSPVLSLSEAIEKGDYVQILLAQRREIVTSLPDEKGPAKAALHRQLSVISKEIEVLQSRESDESEGGANVEDGEFDAAAV